MTVSNARVAELFCRLKPADMEFTLAFMEVMLNDPPPDDADHDARIAHFERTAN